MATIASPHISLAAEQIGSLGGVSVTNSILATWIVMAFLFLVSYLITKNMKLKPGRMQMVAELVVGGLFSFFGDLGGKHGKAFLPIIVTLFLFIVTSNWAGLLPGVGTIGFSEGAEHVQRIISQVRATETVHEEAPVQAQATTETTSTTHEEVATHSEEGGHAKFVPLFRGPTADLNLTLALGLIAFFTIQFAGFKASGLGYLKKFFDLRSPIYFFVGMLEIISDISKIISFAFRLFGNVFAGEVLLTVMAFLPLKLLGVPPILLPLPFYALELFVGVVQGLVFAMLTVVFINVATSHGDHEHAEAHEGAVS